MYKKFLLYVLLTIFLCLPSVVFCQTASLALDSTTSLTSTEEYVDQMFRGTVLRIIEEGSKEFEPGTPPQPYQLLEIEITNGTEKGKHITINHGSLFAIETHQKMQPGDEVIVVKPAGTPKKDFYYIADRYRFDKLVVIVAIFFALAIFLGKRKGITSIFGLLCSIGIIFYFIIPQILKGQNPFLVCIVGAFLLLCISLYLSHGFNKRTSVALLSSVLTLAITIVIDFFLVHLAHLSGNGTEEAFYLQFDHTNINLKGLLLGGIILGVLGVLDDITTAQTATVEELHKANTTLSLSELYRRGISVGREHIASLINTLVLAYVGASFPLILIFSSKKSETLWITLNSTFVAEEIIRMVVGSIALLIAVPLTTVCAAYFFRGSRPDTTNHSKIL